MALWQRSEQTFTVERLGRVMSPRPGDPLEVEGVLNPACARGRDGELYLFPRLVAAGNFSRVGIARVIFDEDDDPEVIERLGVALEPEMPYEFNQSGGGCEDPRVTYMPVMDRWFMTYTAYSSDGPRIAIAISDDLKAWRRLGLVRFTVQDGVDFANVDNKDALLFPDLVPDPEGRLSIALIHRPLFPGTKPLNLVEQFVPRRVDLHRESLWISYWPVEKAADTEHDPVFESHHRLASPVERWERIKVGGGTPPVMTPFGWLVLYHGVAGDPGGPDRPKKLVYSAGVLILDRADPRRIVYRSREPVMTPDLPTEKQGLVANVVFPTAIDQRLDLHRPERFDFYYGMADSRIGAARLWLPRHLPPHATADAPGEV